MRIAFSPGDLVALLNPAGVRGGTTETIRGIAALSAAQPGDLSFLGNPKYRSQVAASRASAILVPKDFAGEPGPGQVFLLVDNPSVALAQVCGRLEQLLWPRPQPGIHPTAVVAPGARIAPSATVGPLCVIEDEAVVGEESHLQAQVFLGRAATVGAACWLQPGCRVTAECHLGDRVRLHPGVVIGSDGFGYEFVRGRHEKVPQVGTVIIGNDVEIGANSTVDRARFGRTAIGEGTKLDNLVQIGHNVSIGRHCILCGQVGVSGSVTLEDYVVLGGQVGVGGHLTIGKGAKAAGGTSITSGVEAGAFVNGAAEFPYMLEQRILVLRRRLPELFQRVDALEALLADVKKLPRPPAIGSLGPSAVSSAS
jgi:UDP-3-O-[3-hydroxymyristoyl] glucosamine N-acyltransferase